MDHTTLAYWINLTLQTRRFGHTYVHSPARKECKAWQAFTHGDIDFSFCGWGKSLSNGGHKYKVHARDAAGKPVSSRALRVMLSKINNSIQTTK